MVVNEAGRLVGIVTAGVTRAEALALMPPRSLRHLPVVDAAGCLVDLVLLDDLRHYRTALGALDGVTVFREAAWARSNYWMPAVLLDPRRCPDVRALIRALNADGIQARPVWHPLHRQPPFRGARTGPIAVADRLWDRGMLLPCSVGITAEERQAVIEALTARLV